MATPHRMCSVCSRPIVLGALSITSESTAAHLKCQGSPRSMNTWPEGTRDVPCLNCGRAFPSDSKVQRLCRTCR